MLLRDIFIETYTAITVNKSRTALTILGIVIGIGSVIIMVAVGRGAQSDIQEKIESIGSNLLTIQPGAMRGFGPVSSSSNADSLTQEDIEALKEKSSYITYIAPQVSGKYQIISGNENINVSVLGTTSEYAYVRGVDLLYGTFLSSVDDQRFSRTVVLGFDSSVDLFGESVNPIGQKIRIKGINFTIIGVKSQSGVDDATLYVPLKTMQQYLVGNNSLSVIDVSVNDSENMSLAEEEITEILLDSHGIKDIESADFRIRNQAEIVQTASSITETFTFLLGAVASISLLVGGIGIMNMMLTSVTERTREIGLRKSLGATVGDIRIQFLLEAITLTVLGGFLGVFSGIGISWILIDKFNISTEVSLLSVFISCGVSVGIGIIFGIYPAWRASKLNPIVALRYE